MDLPVRLMVVMVLLSISLPIVSQALEGNMENMMTSEMEQETDRVMNAMAMVHYSGSGSSRTVEVDLPQGCELSLGGEGSKAYCIRSSCNGKVTSTEYFERPVMKVESEITVTGHVTLLLRDAHHDGIPAVEVSVL